MKMVYYYELRLNQVQVIIYSHLSLTEVVIGFVGTPYAVLETDGVQRVCAQLLSGTLRTDVDVQFSTLDGDATGMSSISMHIYLL